jgi:Ni/Fe-hydrogenase subunit HybB-like protein
MYIYRKIYHLEHYITQKHFVNIGVIMLVLAAFYGYFTFSEYLTKWYGSEKNDEILIRVLFDRYYWAFVISNYVGVLLPLIVIGFRRFRTIPLITLTAVIVIIALWLNRYLIVVPTLESPYLPIQDNRPEWIHYSGTWVEWVLTLGGIASFTLLFTIATRLVPVVHVSGEDEVSPLISVKKDEESEE